MSAERCTQSFYMKLRPREAKLLRETADRETGGNAAELVRRLLFRHAGKRLAKAHGTTQEGTR
jgi:hypothetical protein